MVGEGVLVIRKGIVVECSEGRRSGLDSHQQ